MLQFIKLDKSVVPADQVGGDGEHGFYSKNGDFFFRFADDHDMAGKIKGVLESNEMFNEEFGSTWQKWNEPVLHVDDDGNLTEMSKYESRIRRDKGEKLVPFSQWTKAVNKEALEGALKKFVVENGKIRPAKEGEEGYTAEQLSSITGSNLDMAKGESYKAAARESDAKAKKYSAEAANAGSSIDPEVSEQIHDYFTAPLGKRADAIDKQIYDQKVGQARLKSALAEQFYKNTNVSGPNDAAIAAEEFLADVQTIQVLKQRGDLEGAREYSEELKKQYRDFPGLARHIDTIPAPVKESSGGGGGGGNKGLSGGHPTVGSYETGPPPEGYLNKWLKDVLKGVGYTFSAENLNRSRQEVKERLGGGKGLPTK